MSRKIAPVIVGQSEIAIKNRVRRRRLFESSHGKCFYCGSPVTNPGMPQPRDWLFVRPRNVEMAREHKTPTIRGGRDEPANYVPSCAACNVAKGAFTFDEFRFVRALQASTVNFRFALEPAATPSRDWLCCHSTALARDLIIHNMPSAADAYRLRNGWARGPRAGA